MMKGVIAPVSGNLLVIIGDITVLVGLLMIAISALQLGKGLLKKPGTGGAAGGSGPADWATLLEALGKLPIWALAMIAGDFQIWFGLRLLGVNIF